MKNIDYRFPGVNRAIRVTADGPMRPRVEAAAQLTLEEKAAFRAARDRMPPCDQDNWRKWIAF
jgi:hypothetical protein